MRPTLVTIAICLLALVAGADRLRGESMTDPEVAIEAGRHGLEGGWGGKNWYDSDKDGIRPLTMPKPKVPKKPTQQTPRKRSGFWDWMDGWLGGISPGLNLWGVIQFLASIAVALALFYIAWRLIRAYQENEKKKYVEVIEADPRATSIDRVEALPLDVQDDVSDLLAAARRHYQSGELAMAMVYLFSHQLLELDRHHIIRLVKGKTNRQYLREIKRNAASYPPLHDTTRETVALFEEVFFGKRTPSQAAVASCWNQVEHFNALVKQAALQEEQA